MRKWTNRLLIFGAVSAALLLLLLFISRGLDPIDYPKLALLTLGYPVVILANIVLLASLLFVNRKWALLPLAAIILTWSLQSDFFQVQLSSADDAPYKLLTYNTQLFGLYQFKKNKEIRAVEFKCSMKWMLTFSAFRSFTTRQILRPFKR